MEIDVSFNRNRCLDNWKPMSEVWEIRSETLLKTDVRANVNRCHGSECSKVDEWNPTYWTSWPAYVEWELMLTIKLRSTIMIVINNAHSWHVFSLQNCTGVVLCWMRVKSSESHNCILSTASSYKQGANQLDILRFSGIRQPFSNVI